METVKRPSRRLVLAGGMSAAATAAIAAPGERKLGMIYPGGSGEPREAREMYPSGIKFLRKGVGLPSMTVAGYSSVIDRIGPTAKELADQGAEAIMLMGTSLSFYNGAAFNRQLAETITRTTGLKSSTMSTAVADGLRSVGAKRIAVATAYVDEVNDRLRIFLQEEGFEVLGLKGMGISEIGPGGALTKLTQETLFDFSLEAFKAAPKADAMLISCGALRTLDLLKPLEDRCGVPMVSSLPHAMRAGVRLLGYDGVVPEHGRLLSMA